MSFIEKKEIPILIGFFSGGLMIVEHYFNVPMVSVVASELKLWVTIIAAFGLIYGGITIFLYNTSIIQKREPGKWYFSVYLLAFIIIMSLVGIFNGIRSDSYMWIYNNMYMACYTTSFSLTGFYLWTYAFGAVRAKNRESTLFVLGCVAVVLYNIPMGEAIWPGFKAIGDWVLNVPYIGARRGIDLSIAIAVVVLGLRTLLGIEKGTLPSFRGES